MAEVTARAVIGEAGSVRRPHLDEAGSRRPHEIGESVRPADLDELAPRDGYLAPGGESEKGEKESGGIVVDREGGFCSGDGGEKSGKVATASSS